MSSQYRLLCTQRSNEFYDCKVDHPKFRKALSEALFSLIRTRGTSIVSIVGPSGVGKSMLIGQLKEAVEREYVFEAEQSLQMIPFINTAAVSDFARGFDFKVLYSEALNELPDPFANLSGIMRLGRGPGGHVDSEGTRRSSTISALRERLEREFKRRKTAVWCIDEAQHILRVKAGQPIHQLDVLKSIAQRGTTKLCLVGPPELKSLLYSSGQLARRSKTVRFERYLASDPADIKHLASVAAAFFKLMRFAKTPDVKENIDLIYKGTLGCVGIMKDWFDRAMALAMNRFDDIDRVELTVDDLKNSVLDDAGMERHLAEIKAFEHDSNRGARPLPDDLVFGEAPPVATWKGHTDHAVRSLDFKNLTEEDLAALQALIDSKKLRLPVERRLKPGARKPGRDPVAKFREVDQ